jgi:two-component system CheB/CheR fusion protein
LIVRPEKNIPSWRQQALVDFKPGVIRISVMDNGCGIKPEDLRKIFKAKQFSQVAEITKNTAGTGLGLVVTKLLCEKMGGDIRAFSQENIGTALTICFPAEVKADLEPLADYTLSASKDIDFTSKDIDLSAKDIEFSVRESYRALSSNSDKSQLQNAESSSRIMIVDDEYFIVSILEDFLKKLNFKNVIKAFKGQEAFQFYTEGILEEKPIDVILMDINMPGMNGKEAAKKIRAYEKDRNIWPVRIIMVSANCIESEIFDCLDKNGEIRATQFLKKPVTLEELRKANINK